MISVLSLGCINAPGEMIVLFLSALPGLSANRPGQKDLICTLSR